MHRLSVLARNFCLAAALLGVAGAFAAAGDAERAEQIIAAPDQSAALEERWSWALAEARSRQAERYWVAYAFDRPAMPGRLWASDSGEDYFGGNDLPRVPLGLLLGLDASYERDTVVLMLRFSGRSEAEIDRVAQRGATLSMDFGRLPVFWLGTAAGAQSVARLEALLDRLPAESLQEEVVEALALHADSAIVLPALERILAGGFAEGIRAEAAEGLGDHAVEGSLALAARTAAEDGSALVRREAVEAIGGMRVEGAAAALIELALGSPDADLRAEAAEAAGEQPEAEALPALDRIIFEASDRRTRLEGVEALGDFGEAALPRLETIIWEHPDSGARVQAVETLGDFEPPEALPRLREVVGVHEDPLVVMEALDVLEDLDAPDALAILLSAAELNPVAEVRREAVERLGEIGEDGAGGPDAGLIPRVLERALLADPDAGVRSEAADALEDLRGE